jgi:outer membrane protein assembly factor BamB
MRVKLLLSLAALYTFAVPAVGADLNWANWRGPNYNGSSEATGLPVKFSTTENVRWSADLPGPSAGTPIVWGDYVFVSSAQMQPEDLFAICLDRKTGRQLWKVSTHSGYMAPNTSSRIRLDERGNYAAPSPVTDGKRVIFFYGNGDLVSFTLDGKKQWARNLQVDYGDFAFQWTFSSTPQLYEGRLYLQILQRNVPVHGRGKQNADSFLLCLDPATGKEQWRVSRPTTAIVESREAYSTPIPYVHNGRKEILISGGDILTGHDPATGRELWRWGTWNEGNRETWWRLVPSPVAGGGVVLACAPKRMPVYAAKAGAVGDISSGGLVWRSPDRSEISSDVPTPAFYKGSFYVLSDVRKSLVCVDPATGSAKWTVPTPSTDMCWASPTCADGKVYVMSRLGEVFVFDAADGKLLHSTRLTEDDKDLNSTIAVAHGSLFIRTGTKLYCFGAKQAAAKPGTGRKAVRR